MDMDKDWIKIRNRTNPVYMDGVQNFLNFAYKGKGAEVKVKCPCIICQNLINQKRDKIYEHLIMDGFLETYTNWDDRLEDEVGLDKDYDGGRLDVEEDDCSDDEDDIDAMIEEAGFWNEYIGVENFQQLNNGELDGEMQKILKLLREAKKQLYPGSKFTLLSFILRLLRVKCTYRWSNKSFSVLLEILKVALPECNLLPSSYREAWNIVKVLGLDYKKIHACPNNCMLYWKESENETECRKCSLSRYKTYNGENVSRKVPAKVARYFPLKPRLQRLFMCSETAPLMRWHDEGRIKDGVQRHPADSEAWKNFDEQNSTFASEVRNVRLGLATDGFNPFKSRSVSHSIWPIVLIPYNVAPGMCMRQDNFIMSIIIDGPKGPGNDIDIYMQPLIEELIELWIEGVPTYDASKLKQRPQVRQTFVTITHETDPSSSKPKKSQASVLPTHATDPSSSNPKKSQANVLPEKRALHTQSFSTHVLSPSNSKRKKSQESVLPKKRTLHTQSFSTPEFSPSNSKRKKSYSNDRFNTHFNFNVLPKKRYGLQSFSSPVPSNHPVSPINSNSHQDIPILSYNGIGQSPNTGFHYDAQSDNDVQSVPSQPDTKKGRGRAKMLKTWNTGHLTTLEFNDLGQPIGDNAATLSTQIGLKAKDSGLFPLTVDDWRKVCSKKKSTVWTNFKDNFNLEEDYKDMFLKKLGNRWRAWKSEVKKKYYDKYDNDDERLANCPGEVQDEQWPELVKNWSSEKKRNESEKNKFNRSKLKVPSRTGKCSFATVKHKITKETGQEPTKFDFWMTTHVDMAKTTLGKKTRDFITKLTRIISKNPEAMKSSEQREKYLVELLGPERSGQMRSYGYGPTNKQVQASLKQKNIIDEKVVVLVNSIREGLREELKVELRGVVEEIVRDVLQKLIKNGLFDVDDSGTDTSSHNEGEHNCEV